MEAIVAQQLNKAQFLRKVFNFEKNRKWRFEGHRPCIVDFHAEWCQPCKLLSPLLDELAKEYMGKLDVYGVDCGAERQLPAVFGIRSIPTMLFAPLRGKPRMMVGAVPKETIRRAIRDVLGVEPPGAW
jgi:thioredoxin 1